MGIEFLGKDLWLNDHAQLSRHLHEQAVFASHVIGRTSDSANYAMTVIKNVGFEESLLAHLMFLRSLETKGKLDETIALGLKLLRTLNFTIPSNPTAQVIMEAMRETEARLFSSFW